MAKAERAHSIGRALGTPASRRVLTWNQVMDYAAQAEADLRELLFERGVPARYRAIIEAVLHSSIEPIVASDSRRRRISVPRPAPESDDGGKSKISDHLRNLTEVQIADYQHLRRNGYRQIEALEIVTRPNIEVEAPSAAEQERPPLPRASRRHVHSGPSAFRHLEGLTDQQIADRHALMQSGQHAVAEVIAAADRRANGKARA